MTDHQNISEIVANDVVRSSYLVSAASLQQAKNGPYWKLELKDATGMLEAKIWSPLSQSFSEIVPGQMIEVEGRSSLYRDQLQLIIETVRVLTEDEIKDIDMSAYLLTSSRPAKDMLADIEELCDEILTYKPWKKFVRSVLSNTHIREALLTAPAAKSVHHAYVGGLVEHCLSVAELCMRLSEHYPDVDRQILLVAAVFHDIGKIEEMQGVLVTEYTDEGKLLGHILQGLFLLEPFLQKSELDPVLVTHFRHLIASHHGELSFGAIREPTTPEAFLLHFADNIDAKMAQCRSVLSREEENREKTEISWSPYLSTLGRSLCRVYATPDISGSKSPDHGRKTEGKQESRQCSLL
jgi:3'-5' exoribonuclease